MALKVAIQMDHIRSIDIDADSTFVLALEAQERGHVLYHYTPEQLSFAGGRVQAMAAALQVRRKNGDHFTLGPPETIDLADMDVVLLRQDGCRLSCTPVLHLADRLAAPPRAGPRQD